MSNKQPAILFLASWYPTPNNINHGVFIKNHALALSKYNPVIVVYAYSTSTTTGFKLSKNKQGNFEEWLLEYPKSSHIPVFSSLIKYFRFKSAYRYLLKELIKEKVIIKAIQLNVIFPGAIILPLFKKHFKVPHIIVEHWSGYLKEDGSYAGETIKTFTRRAMRSASKIFYISEKQKQAMLGHGLKGNYELLYNVVDTGVFHEGKETKDKRPLLLHVSSLVEKEKNISGTLRVIKKLQNANYDFDFTVVGGNPDAVVYYKNEANMLGLVNTTFAGEKKQNEVASYMQKAHALILFSNFEGMPVVVLEALATGLPVFVSEVGHLPHLITDELGRIVSVKAEDELEKNLKAFLDGRIKFDKQKMIDFISKNAAFDVVGKKLAQAYNEVCS